mmetsp:Transcript_36430/g.89823  ORF Transcript_36430/g.89823 Transcript_36430/m.89823 type:complete len:223 (+) Transcript_36430:560-1228(+)
MKFYFELHLLEGHLLGLLADGGVQGGGQVALAERRKHRADELAGVLGALGELDGGHGGGARGDAHQEPLLQRQLLGHLDGVVGPHLHHLVQQLRVQDAGDEAGADALDLVRAGAGARQHGGLPGLHRHHLDVGVLALEVAPRARDGAAGAHAAHQDVDLPCRVLPDLRPRGLEVHLRVGGVLELLQHVRVGVLGSQLLRLHHGALHALGRVRQHQVSAERLE